MKSYHRLLLVCVVLIFGFLAMFPPQMGFQSSTGNSEFWLTIVAGVICAALLVVAVFWSPEKKSQRTEESDGQD